jgi:catechol 2,3-dioxygenase-like lactoylglutathione lyase family enzyme
MTVEVRYLVDDVDAAADFYLTHLGFTEAANWGAPFRLLARGELRLWVSGPGNSAARPMPDGAQPVPGGWNRFVIEVDDIIEDPAGNPVELFQPAEG